MSILITTYEGNHNHPLPVSATAMASTTSAAASMLLSGSSSSSHPGGASSSTSTLHGLNFYLSDTSKSKQFYLPNSSLTSPSHPTITLDLTTPPPSSSATSSSHFNRFTYPPNPRYLNSSSTSLNFGPSDSNSTPISWTNNTNSLLYGGVNKNQIGNLNLTRQNQQQQHPLIDNIIYQSYVQKNNGNPNPSSDPITAATKAITSDPSFQSALAAALSSIIGGGGGGSQGGGGDVFGQKLKWGDQQFSFSSQGVLKGNNTSIGCGSSFMNKSSTTTAASNSQPGSLVFQQPQSLPILNSKSSNSSSPGDKEHSH